VFIGTDNGVSWTPVNNGLKDNFANSQTYPKITALTTNGSKIFAGTGNGIFVTTNNGNSWSQLGKGLENDFVNKISFVGNKIFVSTTFGVFASFDDGANFVRIVNNLPSSFGYILSVNDTKIYASTNSGLFVSTDDGAFWRPLNNGLTGSNITDIVTKGTTRYIGTSDDLFTSVDSGATWTRARFYNPVYTLAANATHIYATTKEHVVYVSGDNGLNWDLKGFTIKASEIYSLALVGTSILAGTDIGISASTDIGNNWRDSNTGLTDIYTGSFATISGGISFAGTRYGLYKSVNNGSNWTKMSNIFFNKGVGSMAVVGNKLFVAFSTTVYESTDNGLNFTEIGRGLEPTRGNNSGFELATNGTDLFAGNVNGVYLLNKTTMAWTRLINGMEGWQVIGLDISGTNMFASALQLIVVNGIPKLIYSSFLSTNNGDNWRQIQTSTDLNSSMLKVGGRIFSSGYGGINVSDNNGNSWEEANNGIPTRSMGRLFANGNTVFASAIREGIYYSTNNGANWRSASEGLPTKIAYRISIIGNYLVLGTDMGVFRRPLSEFISVGTKDNKDGLSCVLSPNPVSNQLTINCSEVLVGKRYAINNILGETISSAVLNTNSTQVNVSDLANGIYFLQLIGTSKTIKFVKE
jgi:Secretion system C-terminal sorting domain